MTLALHLMAELDVPSACTPGEALTPPPAFSV